MILGLDSATEITKMPTNFKTVVFVCTGNYYRSRFCEYLFDALAKKAGLCWGRRPGA